MRNNTVIRQNKVKTTGKTILNFWCISHIWNSDLFNLDLQQNIVWPAISVVSMPVYANVTKYQQFMTAAGTKSHSIEDLNAMENETFYTNPRDFILALNMAEYYPKYNTKILY